MNSTNKPRRSLGLEGIKLLLGSGAMAAMIGLWSVFANRDHLTELASQPIPSEVTPVAGEIMLDLPPIPTLVPFTSVQTPAPTSQPSALTTEGLRSVSAPSQPSVNPAAPRVVQASGGSPGGGGGGGGTVTTTRSS